MILRVTKKPGCQLILTTRYLMLLFELALIESAETVVRSLVIRATDFGSNTAEERIFVA
jgi:hypothetical protein